MARSQVYNASVARVTIVGSYDGQVINNVVHLAFNVSPPLDGWTASRLDQAGQAVVAAYTSELLLFQVSAFQLRGFRAKALSGPDGPSIERLTLARSGGKQDEGLPGSVAVCISASTNNGSRSGRGRFYLAGISNGDVDVSTLTPNALQEFGNGAQSFLDAVNTTLGFANLVVYSQYSAGQPRTVGLASPILAMGLRDRTVDSQRRRLPGRGV